MTKRCIMYLSRERENMKAIYFDMDGTIADLYGVDGWLEMLHNEDTTPYWKARPLVNMKELNSVLHKLQAVGFVLGVISWGALGGSAEYTREVKKVKRFWLAHFCPILADGEIHVVKYGTPKHKVAREKDSILVDDNAEVRAAWKGETVDATQDIVAALRALLEEMEA